MEEGSDALTFVTLYWSAQWRKIAIRLKQICMFVYTLREWSPNSLCASVWVREKLLALLIIHRWVFTIGKGELERKWWTPCVVDERSPEVTLFTDIPYLQLCSKLMGGKKEMMLPSCISFPSSCLTDYTSASNCLISCWPCLSVSSSARVFVSGQQDLVICCLSGSRPGSNPARLQESSLRSTQT